MKSYTQCILLSLLTSIFCLMGCNSNNNIEYGKNAFVEIIAIDNKNPQKVILHGLVSFSIPLKGAGTSAILDIKPTITTYVSGLTDIDGPSEYADPTYKPGAVFIVGGVKSIRVGEKLFSHGQVIVRNSDYELVLAKPETKLTIPADIELIGLNKKYKAGKVIVTSESKLP